MIDWQKVCLNLRGYRSLETVAKQIGTDAAHLRRLARGEVQEPRFNTGVKLLDLHFEKFPDKHRLEEIGATE